MTFELDRGSVKVNQCAKYVGQGHLVYQLFSGHLQAHTGPITLAGPLDVGQ